MSWRERLIRKVCSYPPEASKEDVFALLKECGCTFVRYSGNNYAIFVLPDGELWNVPMVQGRRIKRTYLQKTCRRLGLEDEID